jgi:hypothetical protein
VPRVSRSRARRVGPPCPVSDVPTRLRSPANQWRSVKRGGSCVVPVPASTSDGPDRRLCLSRLVQLDHPGKGVVYDVAERGSTGSQINDSHAAGGIPKALCHYLIRVVRRCCGYLAAIDPNDWAQRSCRLFMPFDSTGAPQSRCVRAVSDRGPSVQVREWQPITAGRAGNQVDDGKGVTSLRIPARRPQATASPSNGGTQATGVPKQRRYPSNGGTQATEVPKQRRYPRNLLRKQEFASAILI